MVHGVNVLFDASVVRNAASIAQGTNILAAGTLSSAGAIDTTVTDGVFIVRQKRHEEGHDDDDFGL
jgi:hypothetical protein